MLFRIFGDIFGDHELSGWGKALWTVFLIFLPWLGALAYLIVRGRSMNERALAQAQHNQEAFGQYVRETAGTSTASTADELRKLADLRDRGTISVRSSSSRRRSCWAGSPRPSARRTPTGARSPPRGGEPGVAAAGRGGQQATRARPTRAPPRPAALTRLTAPSRLRRREAVPRSAATSSPSWASTHPRRSSNAGRISKVLTSTNITAWTRPSRRLPAFPQVKSQIPCPAALDVPAGQVSADPRAQARRTLHPDQRALPINELAPLTPSQRLLVRGHQPRRVHR